MKFSDSSIFAFLFKVCIAFIAWYIFYDIWLLNDGRLDEWVSLNIIGNTAGILSWFGYEVNSVNRIIGIGVTPGIEIVNGCNGISAIGLFLGFIIAYPGDLSKKISFSVLGIMLIYISNLIRVIVLVISQKEWFVFFDLIHDYATSAIFYLIIFVLWMIWVNYNDFKYTKPLETDT